MLRCVQVAAALLIALPLAAAGQPPAMSGLVRHRTTGQPIECLHVALADSLDRTVAHTVTDSSGMFVLVAPDTGSYRVQFDLPGLEPLTGPVTRLAAGEMNEQEYPISFDKKIPGELELFRRTQNKPEVVDLGDWHSVAWSPREHLPIGARMVSDAEMLQKSSSVVEQKRFVAQFIVEATGRPRGSSWRTITSNDERILSHFRPEILARQYTPARIGEQPVCQLVMEEMRYLQTGRERPLR
ncbi:MAG: carboxypeptidase regulatory-like domain-containing protein [Gemmatimonadetes bacterium]|nr:carboxypeptidase regulatory-like domain-containing protein [Gemmatimonadota bacterium]